ncbi:MAG: integrase core domain-containing protein, partial [Proteobacteria bacterium]|nr:integrase core domain-containing protein [Pseudomonadota bacterium]
KTRHPMFGCVRIAHSEDSSVDLFRCGSVLRRRHWVIVVMDVFTRRLIGFGVHAGDVNSIAVYRMFNSAVAGQPLAKHISTDHDPLFRFHRWRANLRVCESDEVKSVPYVPTSHPFVERSIGTVRREYLDRVFFWNSDDLIRKLTAFQDYYNAHRVHRSLDGTAPDHTTGLSTRTPAVFENDTWRRHCGGLFQTPLAAQFLIPPSPFLQIEVVLEIGVFEKTGLAVVAALDEMIRVARQVIPFSSEHRKSFCRWAGLGE